MKCEGEVKSNKRKYEWLCESQWFIITRQNAPTLKQNITMHFCTSVEGEVVKKSSTYNNMKNNRRNLYDNIFPLSVW